MTANIQCSDRSDGGYFNMGIMLTQDNPEKERLALQLVQAFASMAKSLIDLATVVPPTALSVELPPLTETA